MKKKYNVLSLVFLMLISVSIVYADNAEIPSSDILIIYFSRTGEQYTVGVIDEGNTANLCNLQLT